MSCKDSRNHFKVRVTLGGGGGGEENGTLVMNVRRGGERGERGEKRQENHCPFHSSGFTSDRINRRGKGRRRRDGDGDGGDGGGC